MSLEEIKSRDAIPSISFPSEDDADDSDGSDCGKEYDVQSPVAGELGSALRCMGVLCSKVGLGMFPHAWQLLQMAQEYTSFLCARSFRITSCIVC